MRRRWRRVLEERFLWLQPDFDELPPDGPYYFKDVTPSTYKFSQINMFEWKCIFLCLALRVLRRLRYKNWKTGGWHRGHRAGRCGFIPSLEKEKAVGAVLAAVGAVLGAVGAVLGAVGAMEQQEQWSSRSSGAVGAVEQQEQWSSRSSGAVGAVEQ